MTFTSRRLTSESITSILSSYFYLLLLIPVFVISLSLLGPGIIISHDFPIFDTEKIWTWVDKGSYSTIETIPRLPIIGLWQIMITLGINSSMISKLMIVSGFFAASFSSYFAFYHLSKRNIPTTDLKLKTAAILASIFYTYNVWSFIRINHWYLWIGYAILPLYILFTVYSFSNRCNWKYFFMAAIIWSLASSTPHMALFYGLIFFATFVVVFLNNAIKRGKWYQALVPFLSIIGIYCLLNAYWIYPFLEASRSYGIAPQYSLNYEIGQILSRDSNFLNTLRLSSEWTNLLQLSPPSNSIIYPLWIFSSFAIPVLAFSALIFTRELRSTLVYFSAIIIGLLLAMGTQSPLGYYVLVFLTPFGWLFRDPDKWSFLIAFGYSFLCGICILKILKTDIRSFRLKKIIYGSFISILLFFTIVFVYPVYKSTFDNDGTLKPISMPKEFDTLNGYLETLGTDKIFFLPYPDYIGNPNENTSTTWSGGREVPSIYQINSLKPNIEIREPGIASPSLSNYYNHLERSIIQNRVNNINNFIYPLGTQYLIFHDDALDSPKDTILLNSLHYLKDLQNIHNVGFFKVIGVGNGTDLARQVGVLNTNVGVIGGLDMLTSLNSIPSFSTINSSIQFLDGVSKEKKLTMLENSNDVILGKSYIDLLVSLANDTYFAKPYDATIHHDPSRLWSKAGAMDPLHGDFHPYLNDLGIQNWDFDYDHGLVITKAMGAKIDIPIDVKDVQNYDLFIRYFKNQKGGEIKIFIDGKLLKQLDTLDRSGNNFIWEKIGSMRLTNGAHILTIENSQGFNAINTFAHIPLDEIMRLKTQINHILSTKNGIYLMEAESSFHNNNGRDTGSFRYLFNNSKLVNTSIINNSNDNNTVTKTFNGTFEVPSNSNLAQFNIFTQNDTSNSSISISDLKINPSYEKRTIFSSSFEGTEVTSGNLRSMGWVNNDKDLVSTSIFSDGAMEGNNSLKVNLAKSTKFGWSTISSQNIPINERSNYNASLEISAYDVKQLHSKILYLDSQKKVLSDEGDYIFEGKDGTFHGIFSASIVPPKDAKYLKFRILEKSENPKSASYLVDNVKLDEIPTLTPILDENLPIIKSLEKNNSTYYEIQSNTLPVLENRPYNYTFTTHTKSMGSVSALVSFKSSTDVVENSTGYGHNASSGAVLSLSNGSKISTTLDIIKPSNYTISLRANMCHVCTNLTISIAKSNFEIKSNNNDVKSMNVSLKGNDSGLHWVNSKSTYLTEGAYDLAIFSNSKADLDLVVVYPDSNSEVSKLNNENHHEKLDSIFGAETSIPAKVSSYKKINPTKYEVEITGATRPYMLSFAESYDPNWIAYYNNNDDYSNETSKASRDSGTNSVPLYSITNGFYLKRTGNYTVFIEYLPQKWFTFGAFITLGFILLSITIILVVKRKIIRSYITAVKTKISSGITTKK